jgi:hypothetical protein
MWRFVQAARRLAYPAVAAVASVSMSPALHSGADSELRETPHIRAVPADLGDALA